MDSPFAKREVAMAWPIQYRWGVSVLPFFIGSVFPRLSFEDENWDLAGILLMLIISAILGVIVPNFLHREPRTHNTLKLINDCLGRVQLAFVSFYLTLLVVVPFKTSAQRRLMGSFLLASFIFFIVGVRQTRRQDKRIERFHGGKCRSDDDGEDCHIELSGVSKRQLLRINLILSIISTMFALFLTFRPGMAAMSRPAPQPPASNTIPPK